MGPPPPLLSHLLPSIASNIFIKMKLYEESLKSYETWNFQQKVFFFSFSFSFLWHTVKTTIIILNTYTHWYINVIAFSHWLMHTCIHLCLRTDESLSQLGGVHLNLVEIMNYIDSNYHETGCYFTHWYTYVIALSTRQIYTCIHINACIHTDESLSHLSGLLSLLRLWTV